MNPPGMQTAEHRGKAPARNRRPAATTRMTTTAPSDKNRLSVTPTARMNPRRTRPSRGGLASPMKPAGHPSISDELIQRTSEAPDFKERRQPGTSRSSTCPSSRSNGGSVPRRQQRPKPLHQARSRDPTRTDLPPFASSPEEPHARDIQSAQTEPQLTHAPPTPKGRSLARSPRPLKNGRQDRRRTKSLRRSARYDTRSTNTRWL